MTSRRGQTALVLILLTAAALIFLAISLNWGRIAQTKAMITTAAYQGASLLSSYPASYGEMQKQTYLKDKNKLTESTGILGAIFTVVFAIIGLVLTIATGGSFFAIFLAALSVVFSITNVILQAVVVQPGITKLWNSLQKNQPQTEQFLEQGILSALQGSVTDQVKITDYLDWNANGLFGRDDAGFPKDKVSRFAVFYTERLRMINNASPISPQLKCFYNELTGFIRGPTCYLNEIDYNLRDQNGNTGWCVAAVDPYCSSLDASHGVAAGTYCVNNPTDPDCQKKIPGTFQLSESCTALICADGSACGEALPGQCADGADCVSAPYTPYCDSCCQPAGTPNPLNPSATIPLRPLGCDFGRCATNNPYTGSFLELYDPTFQSYQNNRSFLAQFGRDQQMAPFSTALTLQPDIGPANGVVFPNGVYPFFWLMNNYSLQVDNIDPTALAADHSQDHWCTTAVATTPYTPPDGYTDLEQLTLSYVCSGGSCCVNKITDTVSSGATMASNSVPITITAGPVVTITSPSLNSYFSEKSDVVFVGGATEAGGTIVEASLIVCNGTVTAGACSGVQNIYPLVLDGAGAFNYTFPTTTLEDGTFYKMLPGSYSIYAKAIDDHGAYGESSIIHVYVPQFSDNFVMPALTAGEKVTLTAYATTSIATDPIQNVTFYSAPTTSLGSSTSYPYSCVSCWTVPATGTSYDIYARVTTMHGITGDSEHQTGTVP